ncbi:fimbrial protein FimV [Ramlibacter tataouinensis]|uniref:FimV/HubP family polar landmark protein n=1 Tax=Ramlibacter tataouinensis TaxID=94132 RepID=UPI0022F3EE44|nr:FimV/HubP family polar landmark protein [Ramlibacter tataouinensis]WBY00915.1 fimbrial protein FimV [Ramlibacter tataouinensis]
MALAAAALFSLPSPPAQALALGRITVQSALGEPLRADIELPGITADEIASLRVNMAAPDAFRAAGMEYSPALSGVTVTLEKRPDGRHFLRLAGQRPVNDPFVDLILETTWSSGRIVRDFTMLFDPPAMRQGRAPLPAQASAAPAPAATSPAPARQVAPVPVAPQRSAPVTASRTPAAPATAPAERTRSAEPRQVTVQSGDTAGALAGTHKPSSVSLDQMLVAMLRANPDAFVEGNVNRLRAGAVLSLPSAEQAQAVGAAEARQTIVAQSRDFNEFRRRLAEGVAAAPSSQPQRQASGRVQAQVEEKKPTDAAPDKLTLSKGGVQGKSGADQIASERAAQDAAARVAELNRNLSELNKLSGAVPAGSGTAPAATGSGPALPAGGVATPAAASASAAATAPAAAAPAAAASAAASAPAAASASASAEAAASAPAAAASSLASAPVDTAAAPAAAAASAPAAAPKRAVAPQPLPEPSLADELLENPLLPAAGGGILALLLGLGIWKIRQRRKAMQVDSSFLESRLQPDSFFGASGGQRIDTAEGTPTGSSMVYSPSQLDAAGDVDPVAEADVYLAYGRDLQAEEILKEALRINPQRIAIHAKLLEIYAKRHDAKAFEQLAGEAYSLARGEGPEWAHICELGLELDPSNPMYQPGGQPSADAGAAGLTSPRQEAPAEEAAGGAAVDLDLDLDFSLDETGADEPASGVPVASLDPDATLLPGSRPLAMDPDATALPSAAEMPSLDMDFGLITPDKAPAAVAAPASPESAELALSDNGLSFELDEPAAVAVAAPPAAAAPADGGMIEFDLGALSLDLGTPASAASGAAPAPAADLGDSGMSTAGLDLGGDDTDEPLATKLALAEEFNAIGDADGARSLAQEVIAEASGDLKSRAQKLLAEIG